MTEPDVWTIPLTDVIGIIPSSPASTTITYIPTATETAHGICPTCKRCRCCVPGGLRDRMEKLSPDWPAQPFAPHQYPFYLDPGEVWC